MSSDVSTELPVHYPIGVEWSTLRLEKEELYTEGVWFNGLFETEERYNRIHHSRLFPMYTVPIAREFLAEIAGKHDVSESMFLVDDADDLVGGLR